MHMDRSEKFFIIGSIILLVVFALAVGISGFAYGIQVPQPGERLDPSILSTPGASPFTVPVEERVRELAPGRYEAYVLSQAWIFQPSEIRIPAGSTITFYMTSKDVQHGFRLDDSNVNMMVLPGHVSRLTTTFDRPGTYNFVCNEYCGAGHHTMFGRLIVEE